MFFLKSHFVFAAMLIMSILFAELACEAAVIRLRPEATVSGSIITLGDIAEITRAEGDLIEKLYRIQLIPAPPAGRDATVDYSTIRSRLLAHGVDLSSVEFTGHSRVKVVSGAVAETNLIRQVSSSGRVIQWRKKEVDRILSLAIHSYLSTAATNAGRYSVESRLTEDQISSILSCNKRTVQVRGGQMPLQGKQTFELRFETNSRQAKAMGVVVNLQPLPFVLAAQSQLPRGHIVRQDDLMWKQVADISKGFVNPEYLIGKETIRPLSTDEIISKDHIQKTQLVRSNDIVSVYVRTTAFTLQRQFKARSNGALGETVKLVDLKGKNPVMAKITGFREAEIITAASVKDQIPGRFKQPVIAPKIEYSSPVAQSEKTTHVQGISLK